MICEHTLTIVENENLICTDCGTILEEDKTLDPREMIRMHSNKTRSVKGSEMNIPYKDKQKKELKQLLRQLVSKTGVDASVETLYELFEDVNSTMCIGYGLKAKVLMGCVFMYSMTMQDVPILFSDIRPIITQNISLFNRFYREVKGFLSNNNTLMTSFENKTEKSRVLIFRIVYTVSQEIQINGSEVSNNAVTLFNIIDKSEKFPCHTSGPTAVACVYLSDEWGDYCMAHVLMKIEEKMGISRKTTARRVLEIRRHGIWNEYIVNSKEGYISFK